MERSLDRYAPYALSLLRIAVALTFVSHGTIKLFSFPVPAGNLGAFDAFSLRWFAAMIELVGGVLLLGGLFTRVTAFVCSGFAAFAFFIGPATRGSIVPMLNTGEAPYLFCFIFLYFACAGGGAWSLDALRAGQHGDAAAR